MTALEWFVNEITTEHDTGFSDFYSAEIQQALEQEKHTLRRKAQMFLIDNGISDIVINKNRWKENTKENAAKWIYLSDILEQYAKESL